MSENVTAWVVEYGEVVRTDAKIVSASSAWEACSDGQGQRLGVVIGATPLSDWVAPPRWARALRAVARFLNSLTVGAR